ncbi:hypothetical protein [Devosia lacusdianchii]|uniref:hypothetical protein n=1 Tax=Devosia lacusdianchii TaxID=2917991 RepID=UPI001F061ADC|nr:hypothetical protein [Devosia sp. JXJ CY 41]
MTHQAYDDQREPNRLADIIAADEVHPTLGKQMLNGVTGLLLLMVTGVVIVLMVLWKSP